MKYYEIYTSAYYAGDPLCIVTDAVEDAEQPDDLVEGCYEFVGDDFKRVIGKADQWLKIANVYIKRGDVLYIAEKAIKDEVEE